MQKTLAIILTIFSALLILDSINFGQALMMFFLAGIIPGTNIAIDATQMLELFTLTAGFTCARVMIFVTKIFKEKAPQAIHA